MDVPFRKYHGTGNDFAVVEAGALESDRSRFGVELSEVLSADGVLVLDLDREVSPPRIEFRLHQPDGSTAAMCGNGARVAARWGQEQTGEDTFVLDTPAGPRNATVHEDTVTVEMGTPTFDPRGVPVDADEPVIEEPLYGFEITAVNTGVPHAVAFVDRVADVDIETAAPPIRHDEGFPEGTNVTFAGVGDGVDFQQRTYERGVEGETQSCGTGAVAIAAVAARFGNADYGVPLEIEPPGGVLTVTVPRDGPATLEGPTAFEFADTYAFDPEGDR
jgi:diaminopimelate epimerase